METYYFCAAYSSGNLRGAVSGRAVTENGSRWLYIALLGVLAPFRNRSTGQALCQPIKLQMSKSTLMDIQDATLFTAEKADRLQCEE